MGKKLTLTFDVSNNFDPVALKHGIEGDRMEIIKTAVWFINCSEAAIADSYKEGAPRRIEMTQLANSLRKQLRKQITKEEAEEVKL